VDSRSVVNKSKLPENPAALGTKNNDMEHHQEAAVESSKSNNVTSSDANDDDHVNQPLKHGDFRHESALPSGKSEGNAIENNLPVDNGKMSNGSKNKHSSGTSETSSTIGTARSVTSISSSKDENENSTVGGATEAPAEDSTNEQIKEAVLFRLCRPQDIMKRNMFAVEGKSIKFPVKVSQFHQLFIDSLGRY
jgi:hypothetical protein